MPTRTYTGIDLTGYAASVFFDSGSDHPIVTVFSPMNVVAAANGSGSYGGIGTRTNDVSFQYNMSGALDFSAFPAIPDNALITKVEVQIDYTVVGVATANADTGGGGAAFGTSASMAFLGQIQSDVGVMPTIGFSVGVNDPASGASASASVSQFNHYTATETFDYSGAPKTKAQLAALFTNWFVIMQILDSAQATTV